MILEMAKYMINDTFQQLQFEKYASIMIDGSTKYYHHLVSVLIYSHYKIYFYSINNQSIQTANALSEIIVKCVNNLTQNGCVVVACTTDNAANNIAALNCNNPHAAQCLSQQYFVRQACYAHTVELSIHDLFDDKMEFNEITTTIMKLLKYFKYPPKYTTVRWKSFSQCINYILENMYNSNKLKQLSENEMQNYKALITHLNWDDVSTVVNEMWNLIIQLEKSSYSIEDAPVPLLVTIGRLKAMNSYLANRQAEALIKRFSSTADIHLPMAAFVCTYRGHIVYQKSDEMTKSLILNYAFLGIEEYIHQTKICINPSNAKKLLFEYLQKNIYTQMFEQDAIAFWKNESENILGPIFSPLREIALRLLNIPPTEVPVERIFSSVGQLLDFKRIREKEDLLEAELIIRTKLTLEEAYRNTKNIYMSTDMKAFIHGIWIMAQDEFGCKKS